MNRFVGSILALAACSSHHAATPDAAPNGGDPFAQLVALPASCSSDHWCWRTPTPAGNDYVRVYSTAPNNVWLIGQHGVVMQWNGSAWIFHHPAQPSGSVTEVAYSMSGLGADDMWLLIGSTIQHWDGSTWSIRDSLPPNGIVTYDSIWEAPNGDVWVSMSNSSVDRSVGGGPFEQLDTGCNCLLGSIWGAATNDFWMTALPGNIMHFDGHTFTTAYSGSSAIGSFVGITKDDIWVSGADGALLHWNGATWTPFQTGVGAGYLTGATALGSSDVWWWDATTTSKMSAFVHWDGNAVTSTPVDTSSLGVFIYAAAIIDGRWWLAGGGGALYTKDGDNTITPVVDPHVMNLQGMWGASNDDMYFATGGEIRYWNGTTMTALQPVIGASSLSGIRTNGVDELFGVGFEETPDHSMYIANAYHYDGSTWTTTQLGESSIADHRYFTKVWAIAPGEAMAVGYGGIAYHYVAGAWNQVTIGVTADLMGIWGPDADHLWITGSHGTLLTWNRSSPNTMVVDSTLSTTDDLGAIAGAGGVMWIGTGDAAVMTGSDSGWTRITTTVSPDAIFAIDAMNVVISSAGQSQLARWNGSGFVAEDNSAGSPTPVLFQPPGGTMLAGGLKTLVEHP
jgi:hypothetical protein